MEAHSRGMSNEQLNDLGKLSTALAALVEKTAGAVVAVKAGAYRTASGISLGNDLFAVASHSLRREERIPIYSASGGQAHATVLGRDPGIDLAILKAEGLTGTPLEAAKPESLKPGMLAAVVGLTTDVGATASLGVLGAVGPGRRIWRGGTLDAFLRVDANVYPSQAGAAVVTSEGEWIGMVTPALSRHSVLAVPVSTIQRIANELQQQGRIRQGYLGVGVQPVAVVRAESKEGQKTGLIVLSVEADSPAEKAGVLLGDVLLQFDGKPMTDVDELHAALRGEIVGRKVKAAIWRGGSAIDLEIAIEERGRKN